MPPGLSTMTRPPGPGACLPTGAAFQTARRRLREAGDRPPAGPYPHQHRPEPDHDQQGQPGPDPAQAQVAASTPARSPAGSRPAWRRGSGCAGTRTSPAPSSTPSSANTTPARGCIAANHGQASMAWASTSGSGLNSRGSTPASPPITTAKPRTGGEPEDGDPAREVAGVPFPAAAERGPDQRLRGDRHRVEGERAEHPQLQRDLVRGQRGGAEPGRHGGRGQEADLESGAAHEQVPAEHEVPPQYRRVGAQRRPLAQQRADEQCAGQGLGARVGDRRADQPELRRVHQQRAEHGGQRVRAQHEDAADGGCPGSREASRCRPWPAADRESPARRSAASASRPRRRPGCRRRGYRPPGRPAVPPPPGGPRRRPGPARTPVPLRRRRRSGPRHRSGGPPAPWCRTRRRYRARRRTRPRSRRSPGRPAAYARGGRRRPCRRARTAARRRGRRVPAEPARPPGGRWVRFRR